MATTKYPAGTVGRDIIDDTVHRNYNRNVHLYNQATSMPTYYGRVNIGMSPITLNTVKNKSNMSERPIIHDIIVSSQNLQLTGDIGKVINVSTGEPVTVSCHPKLIAFIKACAAAHPSTCPEYSEVIALYTQELIKGLPNLNLPINIPTTSKIGSVVLGELNDYLIKMCQDVGIKYYDELEAQSVEEKSSLRRALDKAAGK